MVMKPKPQPVLEAQPTARDDSFLILDIIGDGADDLETNVMPAARAYHRFAAKRRMERIGQREALSAVVPTCPAEGESIHVVSNAKFDFATWIPVMLNWIGKAETLWVSTWTASRSNVVELMAEWDSGRIGTVNFLSGLYFKRRETAVYSYLLEGIRQRGGRFRCSENHAKVLLLDNPATGIYLVVEGSANLTSNPRTEQYTLTHDQGLHTFHREWMNEVLSAK